MRRVLFSRKFIGVMQREANIDTDRVFKNILYISGIIVLILVLGIFVSLTLNSMPSIKAFGMRFLTGKEWDPVSREFGALPFIIGTFLTSFIALLISIPFSFAISILLGEYYKKGILSSALNTTVELLSGIPSIIYGFWGLFVLVPIVRAFEIKFGISPYGVGIVTSAIILAIMIIPYSASLGREVISLVPADIKEAAYSLGATRYEVVRDVVMPYARSGIFAGFLLSLGRALGETMAVTMVIGNSNLLPSSIFAPGNTMASVIANEFTEATGNLYFSALIEVGMVLFLLTTVINIIGRIAIKKMAFEGGQ